MREYRDAVLARLDVEAWYAEQVGETRRLNDTERQFRCPFHEDTNPSANFNVETGVWFCHTCNIGGSAIDFLMRQGMPYKAALKALGERTGLEMPGIKAQATRPITKKLKDEPVRKWHEAALRNVDLMRWFRDHRGFSEGTIRRWELGWDGERVTIPIRDATGALINVRRYLRDAKGTQGKMLSMAEGTGAARLWPESALDADEVILVEGEWDCILMQQYGFPNAATVTSGAGIFKPEWVPLFANKSVAIMYDNDDAGRRGAQRVASMLAPVASVTIVSIPGLPDKGDVTDFFVEQSRDVEELRVLLLGAAPFRLGADTKPEVAAVELPLGEASDARHRGNLLSIPVMVSGKAVTPYTVPSRFTVQCDLGNKKYCGVCTLAETAGKAEILLDASDAKVLRLLNVTDQQQYSALKGLAKAIEPCNRPRIDVHESINIEELRLIPELDTGIERNEVEYVSRTGYLLGHGLRTNRSYRVQGYAHPHPKTQATVHLLDEAIPAQDNISAFVMTPEVRDMLGIFRVTTNVEERMDDIYEDFRLNVHRIQGRQDMQIAYDLVWHSVIAFYFNGAFVRRGWTECMVIGDSGQGKTEMAMALLGHYRMGERVQGEQASGAGIIGGLEKMGDTWILSWGKVPLNDKRLLIIDETQGLNPKQIEEMSDVRATGVAEITKIRTERTNARCRLIWLANPSTGRPLAQYNQGVLAIKDVFHKPEDIRRLDFAIAVATGDVPLSEINARHGNPVPPKYSSEACRSLILWAWSRTPDQVRFTPEGTQAILDGAMDFGRRYHPSIPIVEPADQRLKLARLSAAIAARTFSTDESGEMLVVDKHHVEAVRRFLDRVYDSRGMSYLEYSKQQRTGETLDEEDTALATNDLLALPNPRVALDFLRQAKVFRKTELEEVIGWSTEECKGALKMLSSHRLIRTTRDGYVKQPVFIELLRKIPEPGNGTIPLTAQEIADLPWG